MTGGPPRPPRPRGRATAPRSRRGPGSPRPGRRLRPSPPLEEGTSGNPARDAPCPPGWNRPAPVPSRALRGIGAWTTRRPRCSPRSASRAPRDRGIAPALRVSAARACAPDRPPRRAHGRSPASSPLVRHSRRCVRWREAAGPAGALAGCTLPEGCRTRSANRSGRRTNRRLRSGPAIRGNARGTRRSR